MSEELKERLSQIRFKECPDVDRCTEEYCLISQCLCPHEIDQIIEAIKPFMKEIT